MGKIMIGDCFVYPDDIVSISERNVTLEVKKRKPNPKPKPKGILGKALYSSTITVMEKHSYHVLVLKVEAGTQTVLPDPDERSDFSVGRGSYGTHQLYKFYAVCDSANLIKDAKELQKELDGIGSGDLNHQLSSSQEERRTTIIKALTAIGMDRALYGWVDSNFLDTSVMVDKSIKTKQDFIDKYM